MIGDEELLKIYVIWNKLSNSMKKEFDSEHICESYGDESTGVHGEKK